MARVDSGKKGFLARLRENEGGNVLAMTAAAVFPMIGLIGGGVDMSRMYAVRSRLQAACDAGALTGRRVMGTGQWADAGGRANTNALSAFDLNFVNGSFGSTNRLRSFTESGGTVTGTASADVPMTLMRLFGAATKNIAVTCDGQMRIPNTDVMFVLDNSGSMRWTIPGDPSGITKINGLKVAIKCFYEALAKTNITDVTPAQCGTTSDPSGGLSSQVQLRFGFVNYDNMVNVGKLLPHDYMVDTGSYQSRSPNYETIHAWTLGTETGISSWSSWSSAPSGLNSQSNYPGSGGSNWSTIPGSPGSVTISGTSWPRNRTASDATTCTSVNTAGGAVGYIDTGSVQSPVLQNTTNDPPVYPAADQVLTYTQNDDHVSTAYKYVWTGSNCRLQSATYPYTRTRNNGRSTKDIHWTDYTNIRDWTYQSVALDVSGLKGSGTSWNSSVDLPITQTSGPVVYPSGSSSPITTQLIANTSVSWDGCIEERQTFANSDGNGADDWGGHAWTGTAGGTSTPTDAIDMDVDRIPVTSNDATRWKPLLVGAVWGRRETLTAGGWGGNYTQNPVTSTTLAGTSSGNRNLSSFTTCVTESRKLAMYNGTTGAANLRDYVNTLYPNGNTYHDIGLLWGARLMSPTGIFASENATTPGGAQIQRHLIFMTDGNTENSFNNYASYGLEYWDHRQMQPGAVNNGTQQAAYATLLQDNNNARSVALCNALKNQNITVWAISYGGVTSATTNARLLACSTGASYYFDATSTALLVTQFRQIADKISNLRLTN